MRLIAQIIGWSFILLFTNTIKSQTQTQQYNLGLNTGYGFLITHSPIMEYISSQHFIQNEIYFEKQTLGDKAWHQRYHFPRIGISARHFQLNNPRHLGQAYAISPYMDFKLFGGNVIQSRLRTALGLGYLEKPFDTESNYKNVAVSSHLNMFASIELNTEYKFNQQCKFLIGVSFSHFSNTAFKKPNLGINLPAAKVGFSYTFNHDKEFKYYEEEDFKAEKANWIINLSGGFNELYPPNGKKYFATALQIRREKALNYKSSIGGGIDLFNNPAQIESLEQDSIFISKGWQNLQIGISAYHLLKFNRFGVITQVGYYLKKESEEHDTFYHLVGGRIKLSKRWSGYFALKTHYTVAEYLLIGTAFKI